MTRDKSKTIEAFAIEVLGRPVAQTNGDATSLFHSMAEYYGCPTYRTDIFPKPTQDDEGVSRGRKINIPNNEYDRS